MTKSSKPVTRLVEVAMVRDRGKVRSLAATIYPNGTIGVRPYGTRREEVTTLASVYSLAIKQRVAEERKTKAAAKTKRRKQL
jgi:hypothetical protein